MDRDLGTSAKLAQSQRQWYQHCREVDPQIDDFIKFTRGDEVNWHDSLPNRCVRWRTRYFNIPVMRAVVFFLTFSSDSPELMIQAQTRVQPNDTTNIKLIPSSARLALPGGIPYVREALGEAEELQQDLLIQLYAEPR